jgi:hypothetical protein
MMLGRRIHRERMMASDQVLAVANPPSEADTVSDQADWFRNRCLHGACEEDGSDSDAPPPLLGTRDAPSDNLLAQLLLSAPSVPMLPGGDSLQSTSQHVASLVTPRCPAKSSFRPKVLGCPQAPLGVGCLNLTALTIPATPQDTTGHDILEDQFQSNRSSSQLAALTTARLPSVLPPRSLGSIASVRWGGVDAVKWLQFVPRRTDIDCQRASSTDPECLETTEAYSQISQPATADGEFALQQGESICMLRACAEIADGRLADWVVIVTSRMRSINLGSRSGSESAATLFHSSSAGYEICDIVKGVDGRIEGVTQCACQVAANTNARSAL